MGQQADAVVGCESRCCFEGLHGPIHGVANAKKTNMGCAAKHSRKRHIVLKGYAGSRRNSGQIACRPGPQEILRCQCDYSPQTQHRFGSRFACRIRPRNHSARSNIAMWGPSALQNEHRFFRASGLRSLRPAAATRSLTSRKRGGNDTPVQTASHRSPRAGGAEESKQTTSLRPRAPHGKTTLAASCRTGCTRPWDKPGTPLLINLSNPSL